MPGRIWDGAQERAYREWIKEEASKTASDGCSWSLDIFKPCCWEHDLGYYYGRDPRDAFEIGWQKAEKVTRDFVDYRFRDCNPDILRYRWYAVRIGGWLSWKRHRRKRP